MSRVHHDLVETFEWLLDSVQVHQAAHMVVPDHVQIVVWGVMYIEALANRCLLANIDTRSPSDADRRELWEKRRAMSVQQKVALVVRSRERHRPDLPKLLEAFRRDRLLRDKVVHFGESVEVVNLDAVRRSWERAGRPGEMLEFVRPPRLIRQLLAVPAEVRRDNFFALGAVLAQVQPSTRLD